MNNAPLAQLAEQRTVNPFVAGSSPAGGESTTLNVVLFFYLKLIFIL